MTGLARSATAHGRVALRDRIRALRALFPDATATISTASVLTPSISAPSMRGLEASIALSALGAAILLGLLR